MYIHMYAWSYDEALYELLKNNNKDLYIRFTREDRGFSSLGGETGIQEDTGRSYIQH